MPTGTIWYRDKELPHRIELPNLNLLSRYEAYLQTGVSSGSLTNSSGGFLAVDLSEVIALELGSLKQGTARFRCDVWFRGRKDPGMIYLPEVRSLVDQFEAFLQQKRKHAYLCEVEGEYYLALDLREVIAVNADRITLRSEGDSGRSQGLTFLQDRL